MSHYDFVRRAIVNVTCSWSIKRRWSVDRSMAIANSSTCIWSYAINECNERRAPSNILRVRARRKRRQHDTTALLLHDAAARTRAHTHSCDSVTHSIRIQATRFTFVRTDDPVVSTYVSVILQTPSRRKRHFIAIFIGSRNSSPFDRKLLSIKFYQKLIAIEN